MTATQKAIEDAVNGGWNEARAWFDGVLIREKMLLDRSFWEALGKTRGWGKMREPEDWESCLFEDRCGGCPPRAIENIRHFYYTHEDDAEDMYKRFGVYLWRGLSIDEALSKLV